jgi:hypothetical protein
MRAKASYSINGMPSGRWSEIGLRMQQISRYTETEAQEHAEEQAKRFLEEIQNTIESQSESWVPLTDEYLSRKMNRGLDSRIYLATGSFIGGITIQKDPDGVGFFVGPEPGMIHEPSQLPLEWIASVMEYGDGQLGIPPRPLFGPVAARMLPEFRAEWSSWWKSQRTNLYKLWRGR